MKKLSFLLISMLIIGCSGQSKKDNTAITQELKKQAENILIETKPQLPQFETVVEVLKNAHDYSKEDGTLKILSTNPLHIQVSSLVLEEETEKLKIRTAKHDIIYVVFQAFAQSDINKLTVTAIPLEFKPQSGTITNNYLEQYKKTVTVNRKTAKQIFKKYLNTASFKDLFKRFQDSPLWVPNDKFSKLKDQNISAVFKDLSKM